MRINLQKYLHSPPPAHRGLTVWLPVNSRDDRCELLWRHPRPNRTHPQNQHQQCPACRHSHVHNRWEMFYRWMESTHFTKVKTDGIILFSLTLHCSPVRCFGRVVGGPPSDAQQRVAVGAAGFGEPWSFCVFCLHTQENLQRVQVWPGAICIQHSSCLSGSYSSCADLL